MTNKCDLVTINIGGGGGHTQGRKPARYGGDRKEPPHLFNNESGDSVEFEQILTLVGNYAFPICCCVYLFWTVGKEREAHKAEMEKVTEALNNNTIALTKIEELVRNGNKN